MGLIAVLVLAGCSRGPRAPALEDGAVYQNDQERFRFVVPNGWAQQMKTLLPPGRVAKERTLVLYRCFEPSAASLEVSVRDFTAEESVERHLTKKEIAGAKWKMRGDPEPITLGGVAATRYYLEASVKDKRTFREVVVRRRGERALLFNGMFLPGDTFRRDQIRQTWAGLRWLDS